MSEYSTQKHVPNFPERLCYSRARRDAEEAKIKAKFREEARVILENRKNTPKTPRSGCLEGSSCIMRTSDGLLGKQYQLPIKI